MTLPLTGITSIGGWAFNDCTGLTSFTLPASITSIGEKAFYYCDNLHDLYLHSPKPASYNSGNMAFSKIHYGSHVCTLHVPTGRSAVYAADPTFSVFTQVEEFDPPKLYDLYIAGTQVTEFNASDILGDGAASYDASSQTLTISGNITAPDVNTSCINSNIPNLTINVAKPSSLHATDKAIYLKSNTTITGSAMLTVAISTDDVNIDALYASSELTISNANLSVVGTIWCDNRNMYITNSTILLTSEYPGIVGSQFHSLKVTNSNVNITTSPEFKGYYPIQGWEEVILSDCYLRTPQGGKYDTTTRMLVDADGKYSSKVEICQGVGPTLYNLYIAGTRVTSENASDILGDGAASYDASSQTLTISGNITAPDVNTSCINSNIPNLTINVAKPSSLHATDKAIYLKSNTTITGSAMLTVAISTDDVNIDALYASSELTISNANLSVVGTIWCDNRNMYITNSTILLTSEYPGIVGSQFHSLKVTNSNVNITTSPEFKGYYPIQGWEEVILSDCYLRTPQGGKYDTTTRMLVDADGKYSSIVEIVPIEDPIGIEEILVTQSNNTRKVLHDGKLYILSPDGKVFNAQGERVN